MGQIGCPNTTVIDNLRRVTSQKSADLMYTAAEAWNNAAVFPLYNQLMLVMEAQSAFKYDLDEL
jgi:hypothetical protein